MKFLTLLAAFLVVSSQLTYAQDNTEPPHGMGELEAYSVFTDAYRSDDFELAANFGEWMIHAKPEEIEGHAGFELSQQFERMVHIYAGLAEQESDPSAISAHLDSALEVYDEAFKTFTGDENHFDWYIHKGRFYQEYQDLFDNGFESVFENYEKAYEIDPRKYTDLNDGYYAQILLMNYVSNSENDKALAMIDEIEDYAPPELQNEIDDARNELFDSPEERVEFLESRLADVDGEEEEEILSEIVELYKELGETERSRQWAHELYEKNPNYENTRSIADIYLSDGQYADAIDYLSDALDQSPSDAEKKQAALDLADAHQQIDNLQEARSYARQAIDIDAESGEAFLRMASIYAAAVSECTSGRDVERDDRTVYWLVMDYLEQAKEVDSSVASTADERMASYEPVLPTSEDVFFRDWEDGEEIRIDGTHEECYSWIDEPTTVRN